MNVRRLEFQFRDVSSSICTACYNKFLAGFGCIVPVHYSQRDIVHPVSYNTQTQKHKTARAILVKHPNLIKRAIPITIINIPLRRIARPLRERALLAGRAEHHEGEDEDHDLRAAVEGAAEDVVVLLVPPRVVPPEPDLREDADEDGAGDGGVCPCGHPPRVLVDDGEHDVGDVERSDLWPAL